MKAQEFFKDVHHYAAGMEEWCKKLYDKLCGGKLEYTFVSDFAIGDWYGIDSAKETYSRVKKSWLADYKAFTEVVISLNLLAWANDQLSKQGIEDRDQFTEFYSELYYTARDDYYKHYKGDQEKCDYIFSMTD
jgi:hypothetical protein